MAKKAKILDEHPEVKDNAADYFTFEKTPIIEETVNRGDVRQMGPKAYDITDDDIKDLAKFAIDANVDKNLLEANRTAAIESAVSMAIGSYDNGRWQGRVNSKTSDLIIGEAEKRLKSKQEKKIMKEEGANSELNNTNGQSSKEAGDKGVVVKLKGGKPRTQTQGQTNKALNKMPTRDRASIRKLINKGDTVVLSSIIGRLDKVASEVQNKGLNKMALALDVVANTLEKGE